MAETPKAPNTQPGKFRRRIIVIKRALQMKFVGLVFLSVLLTAMLVSLDVYTVMGKILVREFGEASLLPIVRGASALLAVHISVYLFIVVICAVFVSHKLAGPIFRLEEISKAVAAGDLTARATLRQGDELFSTAENINRMIDSLRERVLRDRTLSARVSGKLEELSARMRSGKADPREVAAQLDELLTEIRHVASDFKL